MRAISLIATVAAFALLASTASAGNAPLVNETTHFVNGSFSDVGDNCATGNISERTVTFSGVSHTLVQPNGSFKFRGNFNGTTSFDDLEPQPDGAPDGTEDATASFRFFFGETVLPTGGQHLMEVWNGTTAVTGGPQLRFHITFQLVLDPAGNLKVEVFRFTCD